ncbi:low temperature requirement protein A [Streptomyces sp. NPDC048111]|uniref:low temperature requirement protein A n=1 Tax=Streptomyces sp. NPDC048111 TaxID=3365500 RepID=UPI0037219FDA
MAETYANTPLPPESLVTTHGGERHASWLELFFDLVAVAGVAQLAHLLHGEPGWRDVGLYVVLYLAFWTNWLSLTLYGNVAGERTRTRILLIGMFGLTVMAAAVHGVQQGERGTAFAVAYAATRLLGGNAFGDRREILVDWPTVSFTAGAVPWTVSIFVHGPARPWLWAAGVAIDLYVTFVFSREHLLHALRHRAERHQKREAAREAEQKREAEQERERTAGREKAPERSRAVAVAHTDTEHLSERLGLFSIIVLGEGVYQIVQSASGAHWGRGLYVTVPGAFLLLVLLWSLSLNRGRGGIPCLGPEAPPTRVLLGLHCFVTGAVAALAAGLGVLVEHADGGLPRHTAWMMATALGTYLVIAAGLTHWSASRGVSRLLIATLPALALCALVGLSDGTGRRPAVLVWLLVLAAAWFSGRLRSDTPGPRARRPASAVGQP